MHHAERRSLFLPCLPPLFFLLKFACMRVSLKKKTQQWREGSAERGSRGEKEVKQARIVWKRERGKKEETAGWLHGLGGEVGGRTRRSKSARDQTRAHLWWVGGKLMQRKGGRIALLSPIPNKECLSLFLSVQSTNRSIDRSIDRHSRTKTKEEHKRGKRDVHADRHEDRQTDQIRSNPVRSFVQLGRNNEPFNTSSSLPRPEIEIQTINKLV
mmetsp:Transcript_12219/g.23671  ORF Transcript_12219/g.23671 Transcript_12219/m.23671 type:complete len:213 (+) Transcript_12219:413-1051(+)